jgi:hypothetical protein
MATSQVPTGVLSIGYYDSKGNNVQANYYGQTNAQAATLIAAAFAVANAIVYDVQFQSN